MDAFQQLELYWLDQIAEHLHGPFLDIIFPSLTRLGDGGALWIALGVVLCCIPKHREDGMQVLLALFFSFVVCNVILKNLVERIRPCDINTAVQLLIAHPPDYSFPSGHTCSSFTAASVFLKNRWKGKYVLFCLAVLIGFSRLYLYVHFPSDVLAGVVIGIILGRLTVDLYSYLKKYYDMGRWKKRD